MDQGKQQTRRLVDFSDSDELASWFSINDVVMGGRSAGSICGDQDAIAVFSGVLSLENDGGFASVRTRPRNWSLDGYTGIRLRVRGDGRTYQLRLRDDDEYDGIAYRMTFKTISEKWIEVDLPFSEFKAVHRGKLLPDIGPPDPSRIRQIGLLIADKQSGRFLLSIESILAYQ